MVETYRVMSEENRRKLELWASRRRDENKSPTADEILAAARIVRRFARTSTRLDPAQKEVLEEAAYLMGCEGVSIGGDPWAALLVKIAPQRER